MIKGASSQVGVIGLSRSRCLPLRLLGGLTLGGGTPGGALLAVFLVATGPELGELLDPLGLARGEVVFLGAVGPQVVELPGAVGPRGDDLPVPHPEGAIP